MSVEFFFFKKKHDLRFCLPDFSLHIKIYIKISSKHPFAFSVTLQFLDSRLLYRSY